MTVFWFLLYAQKERPGGEPYRLCTLQNQCPAEGDYKLAPARWAYRLRLCKRLRDADR